MDWMEQEQERGITITSAATDSGDRLERATELTSLIHLDTLISQLRLSVLCVYLMVRVTVLCAKGGVEPQSETVWRQADKYQGSKNGIC